MRSPHSPAANAALRRHVPGPLDLDSFKRKILRRNGLLHGSCASIVT